jgi:hypothetical protein
MTTIVSESSRIRTTPQQATPPSEASGGGAPAAPRGNANDSFSVGRHPDRVKPLDNGPAGAHVPTSREVFATTGPELTPAAPHLNAELKALLALKLPSSTGQITVHHSQGFEARATELRGMMEAGLEFFDGHFGTRPEMQLAVLTATDWAKIPTPTPFGFPFVSGEPHVAFLPATPDSIISNAAIAFQSRVSPETLKRIEGTGQTYAEAAGRFPDIIGLHELGHTYIHTMGLPEEPKWLEEMLASYLGYAALTDADSKSGGQQAVLYDAMHDAFAEGVTPRFTSLADFDRLYVRVGVENYGWFQGKFQERVETVFAEKGMTFIDEVRAAFPTGSRVTTEEALQRLEKISPGFQEWSQGLK